MFDAPDALATWLGVALAGTAFLGAALAVPTAPPPDAAAVAATVDAVAANDYDAAATHPLTVDQVRVGPRRVTLRSAGGTASATFATRVTPALGDPRLASVLRGTPPGVVFPTPLSLARAADRARDRPPVWRTLETLRVRHVTWGGIDVVLVG